MEAWRSFLSAHATVTKRLESELLEEHRMSLPEYSVLVLLVEAPEHRLRMTELAGGVFLSRSGVTRLVDRMQSDGLIERTTCATDLRVTYAQLTERGYARLRECSGTHLRGVRQHVTGKLAPEDLEQLKTLMKRISAE
jgi:DNA-binding MarR family transcriptional regulator